MGRLKKYKTEQEKIEAQRAWAKEYYHRNKEVINKKTMEKYYELRKNIQPDSRKSEE
jgi:hypothetical protein